MTLSSESAAAALDVALLPILGVAALISGFGFLAALGAIGLSAIGFEQFGWIGVIWPCIAACIAINNAVTCLAGMNNGPVAALVRFVIASAGIVVTCPFFWPSF